MSPLFLLERKMIWIRPDNTDIETNDLPATIKYAQSLGWEEKKAVKKVKKAKKEKQE